MKRLILIIEIILCSVICNAQTFIVISHKGNCKVSGEYLSNRDTLNLSSVITNDTADLTKLLIRGINSSKAYSFSFKGEIQLKDALSQPQEYTQNFKELNIRQDVAIAARDIQSRSSQTERDIIYHNRIEFDIAKILADKTRSGDIDTEAPYDQHEWGLSILNDNGCSQIRLANYNSYPLFVCAIILEDFNERVIYPVTTESYLIKEETEVLIKTSTEVFAEDRILLISSKENMNPKVICEIFPIAEGKIKEPVDIGLNFIYPGH